MIATGRSLLDPGGGDSLSGTTALDGPTLELDPGGRNCPFAGAYIRQTRWAIAIPLAAMLLSDLTWGMIRGDLLIYTFHSLIPFVYGSYAIYVFLGRRVRSHWDRLDAHDSTAKPQAVLANARSIAACRLDWRRSEARCCFI